MAAALLRDLSQLAKFQRHKNQDVHHKLIINRLASYIIVGINENPTDEYVPVLIKGCSVKHCEVNQICLKASGVFLTNHTPQYELFLNNQMFVILKRYIGSDDNKLKLLAIAFLSHLKESSISASSPMANKHKFIDLMIESELIPLCIKGMTSTNPDIQMAATEFISILCDEEREYELQKMSSFKADILSQIQPIYLNHHTSQKILRSVQSIVFGVSKMLKSAEDTSINDILHALGVMLYYDDTLSTPMTTALLMTLSQMIIKVETDEFITEPFQYIHWDQILEHMMDKQALKEYFRKRSQSDKLLFDRTMQKYLTQHCDFEVPIGIRQLIENYYTLYTVKTVDKMEFNLLKRLVQFTDDKYCDRTKFGTLCCLDIIMDNAVSIGGALHHEHDRFAGFLPCFIEYGLLNNLQTLLLSKDEMIINTSLDILLDVTAIPLSIHFDSMFTHSIVDSVKGLSSIVRGWSNPLITKKALLVFVKMMLRADLEKRKFLYGCGIVGVVFGTLSSLFAELLPTEQGWEGIYGVTRRILNDDEGHEMRDLILKHLQSCDQSELNDQHKQHLNSLIESCIDL